MASVLIAGGGTYYALAKSGQDPEPVPQSATEQAGTSIMTFSYPWQPDDLRVAKDDAAVVVQGTVKEVLPAVWTTPDNTPPADARQAYEQATAHIRTPIRLSVERRFKGNNIPDDLILSTYGGTLGSTTVLTESNDLLKPGTRVVLFLKDQPSFANVQSSLQPTLILVVDGDVARGPISNVPLSRLVSELE